MQVRLLPGILASVPDERSIQTADWFQHQFSNLANRFNSGNALLRQLARAFCVHDVAAACRLAMADAGVQLPLDALLIERRLPC